MLHRDIQGLTRQEAARRLESTGPNALPGSEPKSMLRIALGVLTEPMFLMLLAAGGIYLVLGDMAEALFLLSSVVAIIALTLVQERKSQRALEALRELSAPRALVVRDGVEERIASREVVPGDLLVLREGDRVPADALLLQGQLQADESMLTGESAPLLRLPGEEEQPIGEPGSEGSPFVFASTVVTKGVGLARVRATGPRTAVGRIGVALASTTLVDSDLQRGSRRIVRALAAGGLAVAAGLVLLAWLWDGRPLLESALLGIALAMAILPEEIPVVLTVFLALGAWRLSHQKVLARRVQAVEALGGITVLAVDKTGTLTQNRMQVAELRVASTAWRNGAGDVLPESFHELAEFAMLATPADPFDPMEKAIRTFVRTHLGGTEHVHDAWAPEQAYELSPDILAMTHVFPAKVAQRHLLACKGAPEAVADLCHLDADGRAGLQREVQGMAELGLRVLAVARGEWRGAHWPASQHDFTFHLLGLVGLADPPRPEVPAAVAACRRAGIRVIMMTGDHPATAHAIARQVGLSDRADVLTGAQLAAMDEAALVQRLRDVEICARLAPEQKLRLVRALQAGGERVGMTGDGVNDAPALKAAHVGIAMGERGTDVAREAAAIVLLDDSFASITQAISQGRHIDDNIRTAVRFVFAIHVPVIALALVPTLMHWPLLLLPAQVVLFELIIDPACSVVFEAEPAAAGLMERAPRPVGASPFEWTNVGDGLVQGLGMAAIVMAGCAAIVAQQWPGADVRTTSFLALVGGVFLLVPANRVSWRGSGLPRIRNRWLALLVLAVAGMLALVLGLPWMRQVMGFALPSGAIAAAVSLMVAAIAAWLGALRWWRLGRADYQHRHG
ncbi:MAG: P-type ATPase, translocating [Ramlibacter sp.]|jgi:Ca2+-transporting ATPase|nr:P-type ATPase, translocating [Ramlibacter sp.]